jgi:hypothetical protein
MVSRSSNAMRNKLLDMDQKHPKRLKSAYALLNQIEKWCMQRPGSAHAAASVKDACKRTLEEFASAAAAGRILSKMPWTVELIFSGTASYSSL